MRNSAPPPEGFAALAAAFHLDRFGVGRHILRDHRGWRVRDIHVKAIWLAGIFPSFHRAAYLMAVHTDTQPRALLCFRGAEGLPLITGEAKECPGLHDGVAEALGYLDLFPPKSGGSLDGIGYRMQVFTSAATADLEFFNPTAPSFRKLENALFQVAQSLSDTTEQSESGEYLKIWAQYLQR